MSENDHIRSGQAVVRAEMKALSQLADAFDGELGKSFSQAVEIIQNISGHLIIAGVGKSGHIGRKLAASFASTGTPSFFMHPTEAAHGDLGMIAPGCAVLAISNSGESQELAAVAQYARTLNVPVLGLTSGAQSSLARRSDIALILPRTEEACPNGLAPTTSTTNALAFGDALIVTVMKARGFTRDDFGRRHPAGRLGLRLQTIGEWADTRETDLPLLTESASMTDTVESITRGGQGCAGVVRDNKLVGMITDGDLRRAMTGDFMSQTASDIMTKAPRTVSPDMTMGQAVDLMTTNRISTIFCVDQSRPIALLDLKSLVAAGYA